MHFTSNDSERTIRVASGRQTWKELIETLEEVQGVKYTTTCFPRDLAIEEEKKAFVAGDVNSQLVWSAKPLAASGYADLQGPLDNDVFDFVAETPKETFQKLFGKK